VEEGAEAQSASVGGLDTRQGEDEGESSSRDASIKAASWWVSGVGTEVSVKVSSARLLLFFCRLEFEPLLAKSRPPGHGSARGHPDR
jgi:hypothetical protein